MASIHDLTDDLIAQCFLHLRKSDLATAASVCRRWNTILEDGELWRTAFSQEAQWSRVEFAEKFLRLGPTLTELRPLTPSHHDSAHPCFSGPSAHSVPPRPCLCGQQVITGSHSDFASRIVYATATSPCASEASPAAALAQELSPRDNPESPGKGPAFEAPQKREIPGAPGQELCDAERTESLPVGIPWRQVVKARRQVPRAVVLDGGSGYCKFGWSTDKEPRNRIATFLEFGNVESPVLPRLVTLFRGIFARLGARPDEQPVVLSEPLCHIQDTPAVEYARRQLRETTCSILFNRLNVPAVCAVNQAVLALFSAHLHTGIVVNVGFRTTTVVPIVRGQMVQDGAPADSVGADQAAGPRLGLETTPLAAMRVTGCLSHLMELSDLPCDSMFTIRTLKEKLCYVSHNFEEEMAAVRADKFTKQAHCCIEEEGGAYYELGPQRFQAPEILFQPGSFGLTCDSVQEAVARSIMKCDKKRKELQAEASTRQQGGSSSSQEGEGATGTSMRSTKEWSGQGGLPSSSSSSSSPPLGASPLNPLESSQPPCTPPLVHRWQPSCKPQVSAEELRSAMENVVVAGGTAALPGFAERLKIELKKSLPKELSENLKVHPNRFGYYSAWMGGKLVAQCSSFPSAWCVTREQYRSEGCEVVHGMAQDVRLKLRQV